LLLVVVLVVVLRSNSDRSPSNYPPSGGGYRSGSPSGGQDETQKVAGAIRAVDAAMSGQHVRAADYDTTNDEIFNVFKAKIVLMNERLRRDPSSLDATKSDSLSLLRAMERVDPNRHDTIEFRRLCKDVGFLD
jgi:hypothetical protein